MSDNEYYEMGRKEAMKHCGEDALMDDGTLEHIFPAAFIKGYRETLLAIRLVKQHGIEKVFGIANANA
jgi:hypothetical protein